MASAVELSEYDSISKELKELRSTCELQGKNFKEVIANDPALKRKAIRFKKLKVKVRQHREQEKQRKTLTNDSLKTVGLDENEAPLRSHRGRKRRFTEYLSQQPLGDISTTKNVRSSPSRKRLKTYGSYRNKVGFSPCFRSLTARKPPKPKESVITNLEPISMEVDNNKHNNNENEMDNKIDCSTLPLSNIKSNVRNLQNRRASMSNFGNVPMNRLNISSPAMASIRGVRSKTVRSLQSKLHNKSTKEIEDKENIGLVADNSDGDGDCKEQESKTDKTESKVVEGTESIKSMESDREDEDIAMEKRQDLNDSNDCNESDDTNQVDKVDEFGDEDSEHEEHEDEDEEEEDEVDYDGDSDEYVPSYLAKKRNSKSSKSKTAKTTKTRRSRTVRTRKSTKSSTSSTKSSGESSGKSTKSTRSSAKTKRKKAKSVPQTVQIKKRCTSRLSSTGKKIKKSVKIKSKTSKKQKETDRKLKKEGDLVSKNFKKTDLRSKRYNNRHKKKNMKFKKWDKFGNRRKGSDYYDWKERQRQQRIKSNNVDLDNEEAMKKELNSDSDAEQEMAKQMEMEQDAAPKENEDDLNIKRYSERLHQLQIGLDSQRDPAASDSKRDSMENSQNEQNANLKFNQIPNENAVDELLHDVLKREYGYDSFRNGQKEAIKLILQNKSVLLLLSTGAGKSLCYQIPTILRQHDNQRPVTLVISPLISLMKDQCENLPSCLKGKVWRGSLEKDEVMRLRQDVVHGKIHILYIAPEKLDSNGFRSFLKNTIGPKRLQFACIDEAHCISEWSHNFRPSYLRLRQILRDYLEIPCILACTATATVITQRSIQKNIGIDKENVVSALEPRRNLHLTVGHMGSGVNKKEKLVQLLCSRRFRGLQSLIVYATTRHEVDELASKLNMRMKRDFGAVVEGYHAGKKPDERADIQERFMNGKVTIMVATIAFGMGLNKRDVRGVVHYSMPKTMEHYVQEVGRAGRDGLGSECHVFYDHADLARHRSWVHMNGVDLTQIKRILYDVFSAKNVKIAKNAWIRNQEKKKKVVKIKSAVKRKKRKKDEDQDFSDEDDMDSDDEGFRLTEFKAAGDVVTIHKTTNTEQRYDASMVVLGTIFTYLDVYKAQYLQQLPSHYDKVKIGLLRSPESLEKESEILKFIINGYKPKNGCYVVHLGKLHNDMRHISIRGEDGEIIDITTEYTVYQIQRHLKDLQFKGKVSLYFDDECFVLKVQREMDDHDELVALCDNVFEYVSQHEKSECEKIDTLAQALKIIANNEQKQNVDEQVDGQDNMDGMDSMEVDHENVGGEAINQKQITLHELVDHYFKCEEHDEFLDFVQSYLPSYDHIRNQPVSKTNVMYEEVRESLEIFMKENPAVKRVRSIAKIFHGFRSPLFPIQMWCKNKFWAKYTKFPFMQIMEIAKEIKAEKKKRMVEAKNNGNRLVDATNDGNDTDSSVSEFSE